MIKTCAEIHRMIWYPKNLGIAQGYGNSPRDRALLHALANQLNVPGESFIVSDESKRISAQQYLMAMLEILEPLSEMFQDIWLYCERTFIRTSKHGTDIAWNFKIHSESIRIDFEAFRKYQRLRAKVPVKDKFNRLCNEFAVACRQYVGNGYGGPEAPMPPKPPGAAPSAVATKIHDMCVAIRAMIPPEDGYWGIADAFAKLSAIQNLPSLWKIGAFPQLRSMLDECDQVIEPQDILSLPFWKYRWHIYELWCLITTLKLFERRGFELIQSTNGASLLELGTDVLIAQKRSGPTGQIFYQPRYQRRTGAIVNPDIVIVHGDPHKIQPDNVAAIVECKQHKMPEDEGLKGLKEKYFAQVAESYTDSIAPNGKLVLVNYDKVEFETKYTLIGEFAPAKKNALEAPLAPILDGFSEKEVPRQAVLIVDGSTSMASVSSWLQGKLEELRAKFEASDDVIYLLSNGPRIVNIKDAVSVSLSGSESTELFIAGLRLAQKSYPLAIAHVITDLAPDSEIFSGISQTCNDIAFRIHCIN